MHTKMHVDVQFPQFYWQVESNVVDTRHCASKGRFKVIKTQYIQQVYETSRMHKICADDKPK